MRALCRVASRRARAGWLNGVNVLIADPAGLLPPMLPEVPASRAVYFNEWLVHRLRLAELAPEALILADAVVCEDAAAERDARAALEAKYRLAKDQFAARHADRNVSSRGLTPGRINSL